MSEWVSVKDKLPDPFDVVWVFWRDKQVLLACRTYYGEEAINCLPQEGWYSFEDEKCKWCFWWMPVTIDSLNQPEPPK